MNLLMKFNMLLKKLDSISEKESDIMIFFVVCFAVIGIFALYLGLYKCFAGGYLSSKIIPMIVGTIFMLLSVAAFVVRNYQ